MLRQAVLDTLMSRVPILGGRVYEAWVAPDKAGGLPYATIKLPGIRGSTAISFAGSQPVEVRLYNDRSSFIPLDMAERAVIEVLTRGPVADGPDQFSLQWVPGGGDFEDDEFNLIGRLVMFEAAVVIGKGG